MTKTNNKNFNIKKKWAYIINVERKMEINMACNMNGSMPVGMNRSNMGGNNCGINRNYMNGNIGRGNMNFNGNRGVNRGCMAGNTNENMAYENSNCGCNQRSRMSGVESAMDMLERRKDECGCNRGDAPVDKMKPGMAFVPWQKWEDIYDMEKALERGTIFCELDKPYLGRPVK